MIFSSMILIRSFDTLEANFAHIGNALDNQHVPQQENQQVNPLGKPIQLSVVSSHSVKCCHIRFIVHKADRFIFVDITH